MLGDFQCGCFVTTHSCPNKSPQTHKFHVICSKYCIFHTPEVIIDQNLMDLQLQSIRNLICSSCPVFSHCKGPSLVHSTSSAGSHYCWLPPTVCCSHTSDTDNLTRLTCCCCCQQILWDPPLVTVEEKTLHILYLLQRKCWKVDSQIWSACGISCHFYWCWTSPCRVLVQCLQKPVGKRRSRGGI